MVHTFIVTYKIDVDTKNEIRKSKYLRKLKTKYKLNGKWILTTTELWQYGFDEIQLIRVHLPQNMYIYFIRIIINPAVVLFGYKDIGVVDNSEILSYRLERRLNLLLKNKLNTNLKICDFSTRRIDYAVDYRTKYVEETLRLMHKGKEISKFRLQNYPANESYYSIATTVRLNLYNKQNHLIKEQKKGRPISQTQIDIAKDILRLEIQCKADKIKYLKKKYALPNCNPITMLRPGIAIDVISYYCNILIGESNFYSYKEAEIFVLNSAYKKGKKLKLLNILKLIAKSCGIAQAKNDFISGKAHIKYKGTTVNFKGCESTFIRYIKNLMDIGVNPITIPRDRRIDYLENPVNCIHKLSQGNSLVVSGAMVK